MIHWYMNTQHTDTDLLWIHACNKLAGSCKLQLQGRKSLTWSEDNPLSHNVIDIWISGLWNVLRIRWVLHITFEIRMNCPNAWIIMNDNPCWLYLYPEHEVYRSPCPTVPHPPLTRHHQTGAEVSVCWLLALVLGHWTSTCSHLTVNRIFASWDIKLHDRDERQPRHDYKAVYCRNMRILTTQGVMMMLQSCDTATCADILIVQPVCNRKYQFINLCHNCHTII